MVENTNKWVIFDLDGTLADIEIRRKMAINSKGKMVHQQPISYDPFRDGRDRIETYVWKLYRTEWTSQIPPGEYMIIVGTDYDKSPTRNYHIEVDIL